MNRSIIYQSPNRSNPESTSTKRSARRSPLKREPILQDIRLTNRHIALLNSLRSNGVLNTLQVAMLFFPPDLECRLAHYGIPKAEMETIQQQYSVRQLHEAIEFNKWRMATMKLQSALFRRLAPAWQAINSWSPTDQLLYTLKSQEPLPDVYLQRKRLASDFISTTCKKQLRDLFDAGYIDAEEQPTRLHEGRKPTLWYLGKKGAQFLAQWHGLTTQQIRRRKIGSYSPALLQHRLDNNDIRISFMLAAQRQGYQIRRWLDDEELRRLHSQSSERVTWHRRKNTNGNDQQWVEEKGTVVADHYLWLDTGKQWHNFIECDRGTKTDCYATPGQNDFARKVYAFSAYYKSGQYTYTYPDAGKSMRVLTITTSLARLQNLKTVTESVLSEISSDERERQSGLKRYWFTTLDKLRPTWHDWYCESTILDAPVWWQAGRAEPQPAFW